MNLAQWISFGAAMCAVYAGVYAALLPSESEERVVIGCCAGLVLAYACVFAALGYAQQIGLIQ